MSKENDKGKKVKDAKAYKLKIKRHKDAVLSLYSQDGINGSHLVSGSADHTCRIWDLKANKISERISVARPAEGDLFKYKQ